MQKNTKLHNVVEFSCAVRSVYFYSKHYWYFKKPWNFVYCHLNSYSPVAYPGIFFRGRVGGCSTNSVEDREQREWGSGGGSPLVRGSTQFANEWNPYSDKAVTNVYSTELGIRLSFGKTSEFRGVGGPSPFGTPPIQSECKWCCVYPISCTCHIVQVTSLNC
jgi:hypothetical protein